VATLDSVDDVKAYLGTFATKTKLEEAETKELQLLFKRTDGASFRALSQSDIAARIATKSPPLDVEVAQLLWQQISRDASAPAAAATSSSSSSPAAASSRPVVTPSSAFGKQSVSHLVVASDEKYEPAADEVSIALPFATLPYGIDVMI
jgi:hypothetical protein